MRLARIQLNSFILVAIVGSIRTALRKPRTSITNQGPKASCPGPLVQASLQCAHRDDFDFRNITFEQLTRFNHVEAASRCNHHFKNRRTFTATVPTVLNLFLNPVFGVLPL